MKRNSTVPLKRYRQVISGVHTVYRLVNSTFNTKELLLRLTRLLCQLFPADGAMVLMVDESRNKILSAAIFNGKFNIFLERREDLEAIPAQERAVAFGKDIVKKYLLGLPLIADDHVGAIFIRRRKGQSAFSLYDQELLGVIAEQIVTAIKKIQLYEQQQAIILSSIRSIGKLLARDKGKEKMALFHTPVYFKVIKSLAERIGMRQSQIECLRYASLLHVSGAIDVPYEILSKTSQLTPEDFKIIHEHPAKNVELIQPVEFLKPVLPILLYHHEKYDGTGYPSGLKKEQIPLGARVMALVDAFEAMVGQRPYRRQLGIDEALEELKRNSGTQFDPVIVQAFADLAAQKKFRNYLSLMENST